MQARTMLPPDRPVHVFEAGAIRVSTGVNLGDPLDLADLCAPGDIYQLARDARLRRLVLDGRAGQGSMQTIAPQSGIGQPGDRVSLVARHVLMGPEGDTLDVLMIRHEAGGALYALPLSPMVPRTEYALLESHEDPGEARLADLICVAFGTGTMIAVAGQGQQPIESLVPGQMILTRDNGPQPLRVVARARLRALGSFAPVVISAGTLGNVGNLVVSPHHRIFLYRRGSRQIGESPELLVQARHLVDNDHVWRREGGFVDYHALVFDRHEIIYAEGIPCESLMVTDTTLHLLPDELGTEIRARLPNLRHLQHSGTEAGRETLARIGREALFRRRDTD